ncbi:MAG: biotin/lipoyl-binding protein [Chitinophagales bacterium]|nr:biotin/lipoyl-binding protein [Chitinophagales bacterium]MCZ2394582.1 biotin/lipoyl-binding protein [Chitinophagales bacterium]
MKYKVNDSKEHSIDISFDGEKIKLNEEEVNLNFGNLSKGKYHVIKDNQSYNLEVISSNIAEKTFTIKVNGKIFQLSVEDALDKQLREMGMSKSKEDKVDKIIAPMPGLVLKILVTPGQTVNKGDSIIILEAMKMENVIKCTGDAVVKAVHIQEKDAVEKNQLLIEME